jgi:hypothetical protein
MQRKYMIKEGNREKQRQIMSPVWWCRLLWVPKDTSFTPPPFDPPPQQLPGAHLQSYIHSTAKRFPRNSWKFRKHVRLHLSSLYSPIPSLSSYFLRQDVTTSSVPNPPGTDPIKLLEYDENWTQFTEAGETGFDHWTMQLIGLLTEQTGSSTTR